MIATQEILVLLAALSSLTLAAVALARRPRGMLQWSFALGMLGFAVEALLAWPLLSRAETPEDTQRWLQALELSRLVLPVPWLFFVASLAYPQGARAPVGWRVGVLAGTALATAGALATAILPAFEVSPLPAPFYAARLAEAGRMAAIVQILSTVGILAALEVCLRTSRGATRWRIKYLVLGLGGIFLVRFYLLSQLLLFHVLMASYLTTGMATLFVGNLVIGASLARERLQAADLTVSRHLLYRSAVIGVLGVYLLVVGALGWLLNRLGIGEDLFWGSLLFFVTALGLATVLLSENVRWRMKRFIGLNFYRSKYDYRQQWVSFTERLGALLAVDELAPQLLGAVTEAVGTNRGALYLVDARDGRYHLAGVVEVDRAEAVLEPDAALVARFTASPDPVILEPDPGAASHPLLPPGLARTFADGSVAVPLHSRDVLTGFMIVGPERTGAPYGAEDLEFLGTVAEQVAATIVSARLSESLAQSREFEAFHRLTSFVIHDLKNSISSLSLLSENALAHFDDPEFQRDAIKTLSRTVDRMKGLLARLSSAPESALRFQPIDLEGLVREATGPLAGRPRLTLVTSLAPLPPIAGDPDALMRVIQNLLKNAVEAMDGEGTLTVTTSPEDGQVVLSVADTGCGIAEEFLRKSLFAPFRSTKKGGWGIGLYHAKAIVEGHGGRIEVSSKEGEGTTFRLRLPLETSVP